MSTLVAKISSIFCKLFLLLNIENVEKCSRLLNKVFNLLFFKLNVLHLVRKIERSSMCPFSLVVFNIQSLSGLFLAASSIWTLNSTKCMEFPSLSCNVLFLLILFWYFWGCFNLFEVAYFKVKWHFKNRFLNLLFMSCLS